MLKESQIVMYTNRNAQHNLISQEILDRRNQENPVIKSSEYVVVMKV